MLGNYSEYGSSTGKEYGTQRGPALQIPPPYEGCKNIEITVRTNFYIYDSVETLPEDHCSKFCKSLSFTLHQVNHSEIVLFDFGLIYVVKDVRFIILILFPQFDRMKGCDASMCNCFLLRNFRWSVLAFSSKVY